MRDVDWADYVAALGQEFCGVIDPDGQHDLVPHDAADAVIDAVGRTGSVPAALQKMTRKQHVVLAQSLAAATEIPVTDQHVVTAIQRLLQRWPALS